MSDNTSSLPVRDEDIDLGALSAWLERQGLPADITAASRLGGGTQNIVLRLTVGGKVCVLRHPPATPRAHSNRAMAREMRILQALRGSGVPHPGFITGAEAYPGLGGATFYLMEIIAGFNPSEGVPELYRNNPTWVGDACLSVVSGLARLGTLVPGDLGLDDLDRSAGFLQRAIDNTEKLYRSMADEEGYDQGAFGEIATIVDWLRSDIPSPGPAGIVHGDFQLNNVMLSGDEPALAAIIDWEMCTVGDPLLDLGWLMACWPGEDPAPLRSGGELAAAGDVPTRREALAAYAAHSDRDLSRIDWYVGLAAFKLGTLLETTYVRSLHGEAPVDTGLQLHELAVDLMRSARDLAAGRWTLPR